MNTKELEKIMESAAAASFIDEDKGQACITLLQLELVLQKLLDDDV